MAKKITPPFIPSVVSEDYVKCFKSAKSRNTSVTRFPSNPQSGPTDLRHFDPEFTHLPVTSSLCTETLTVTSSIREAAGAFPGFSYGPPAEHAFM